MQLFVMFLFHFFFFFFVEYSRNILLARQHPKPLFLEM